MEIFSIYQHCCMDSLQIKAKQLDFTHSRIIYDLCGGTGSWSRPYRDAGYTVHVIDTKSNKDVRWLRRPDHRVHGVLAAPPCTHFSSSGAQYWSEKDEDERTLEDLSILDACIRFIFAANPMFWALENPVGRMVDFLGPPAYKFNPCDFGDAYTKKTYLWGKFNRPKKRPVEPETVCSQGSWLMRLGGRSDKTKELRSTTPPAFAAAFFAANP